MAPGWSRCCRSPTRRWSCTRRKSELGEGRVAGDVGEQLEQPGQVAGEAVAGDVGRVHAGAGAEAGAEEPQLVGDLGGGPGLRPLGHHRGGEAGHAGEVGRIPGRAAFEQHQVDGDDGEPVVLDEPDGEAVLEPELLLRRELQVGGGAERRDLGPGRGLRRGGGCGGGRGGGAGGASGRPAGVAQAVKARSARSAAVRRARISGPPSRRAAGRRYGVGTCGMTVRATLRVLASQAAAAARTSLGVTARKRSRSFPSHPGSPRSQ